MKHTKKGWEDITLQEFLDLNEIFLEAQGIVERGLEVLCYLTDSDEWEEVPPSVIIEEYKKIGWINNPPLDNAVPEEIGKYKLKPFSKLNLSEWIDLDSSILDNDLAKITAIVYRQFKTDEWGNIVYEPYEFSLSERSKVFLNTPITKIIGLKDKAFKYREKVIKSFSGLFEGYEDETLTEEEKEALSDSEIKEIEQNIKQDNRKKDFAWQKLLNDITGGNWASIPEVLKLPHTFVFNMRMAMKVYS